MALARDRNSRPPINPDSAPGTAHGAADRLTVSLAGELLSASQAKSNNQGPQLAAGLLLEEQMDVWNPGRVTFSPCVRSATRSGVRCLEALFNLEELRRKASRMGDDDTFSRELLITAVDQHLLAQRPGKSL